MKIEMYEKVGEVIIETKELLTATQARAITKSSQSNEINKCVKHTLARVEEEAKQGQYTLLIDVSSQCKSAPLNLYIRAMESLGYILVRQSGYWFTWRW